MGKHDCAPAAGALIERGRIAEIADGGYRVANLDRPGLTSRVITGTTDTAYAAGDIVLFVMYRDGTGKIISRA